MAACSTVALIRHGRGYVRHAVASASSYVQTRSGERPRAMRLARSRIDVVTVSLSECGLAGRAPLLNLNSRTLLGRSRSIGYAAATRPVVRRGLRGAVRRRRDRPDKLVGLKGQVMRLDGAIVEADLLWMKLVDVPFLRDKSGVLCCG